jgi:hypothetical protein
MTGGHRWTVESVLDGRAMTGAHPAWEPGPVAGVLWFPTTPGPVSHLEWPLVGDRASMV